MPTINMIKLRHVYDSDFVLVSGHFDFGALIL